MQQHYREPIEFRRRILFFDEAHGLSIKAADSLLKVVEETRHGVVFCFATTEPTKVQRALQSRVIPLEVRPLGPRDAIAFLREIAEQENIEYEGPALDLLAGLKRGFPRDLLLGLEHVYQRGQRLTLDRVRAVFDVDYINALVDYFLALGRGDLAQQTEVLSCWRETPSEKVRWIQAFLTSLYYVDIQGLAFVGDALTHAINNRAAILDAFCERLGVGDRRDLAPYWRKMMVFWPVPERDLESTAIQLRLALFHHLVNHELLSSGSTSFTQDHHAKVSLQFGPVRLPPGYQATSTTAHPEVEISGRDQRRALAYFTKEDARTVINTASFFTQEYGVFFNAFFEVRPSRFGVESDEEGQQLVRDFCEELGREIAKASGGDTFAYLVLFERQEEGLRGLVVAHLPSRAKGDGSSVFKRTKTWQRTWRLGDRTAGEAIISQFQGERRRAQHFHWDKVTQLCAGLDEQDVLWDDEEETEDRLLDLLGIRRPRAAGPVLGPVIQASQRLTAEAIEAASRHHMAPLSAFDAKAWSWIREGWELWEHADRTATRERRLEEIAILREQHKQSPESEKAAIEELIASWRESPERRPRSWQGWWASGED